MSGGVVETPGACTPTCRVAMDLVRIRDVQRSIDRFGDRYLRRVYTDHELWTRASIPGATGVPPTDAGTAATGLAARFAAKSATLKILQASGVLSDLRTVEILHHPEGARGVSLSGDAARAAAEAGIGRIRVSLSLGGGTASAIATAVSNAAYDPPSGSARTAPARRGGVDELDERIRSLLNDHGRLPDDGVTIGEDDDLFRSGLTSHAGIDVLLAVEEEFGVTIPAPTVAGGSFRSIAAIRDAVRAAACH